MSTDSICKVFKNVQNWPNVTRVLVGTLAIDFAALQNIQMESLQGVAVFCFEQNSVLRVSD